MASLWGSAETGQQLDALRVAPDEVAVLRAIRSCSGEIVDLRIVRATAALARLVRTSEQDVEGRTLLEVIPWHDTTLFASFARAIDTGQPYAAEFQATHGGAPRLLKVSASPFEDGLTIVVRDVTDEHSTADSLAHGNALFAAITDALNDAVIVWSAVRDASSAVVDLRVDYANAAAERLLGERGVDIVGTTMSALLAPGRGGSLPTYIEVLETGAPTVLETPYVDGRVIEASVVRFGDGIVTAGREITVHKDTLAQLQASEQRYRLLTDHAGDGVFLYRSGRFEWVSPGTATHYGWTESDLLGRDVLELIHPDDVHAALEAGRRAADGSGSERIRVRVRCKDGRWLWSDYRRRPLADVADPADRRSGGVASVWNVQAEVEALQALAEAEEQRAGLEERLAQAQKLESLGQLTGGVAHDFNNLLTVIVGGAEMMRDSNPDDPMITALGDLVLNAAQRGADLTARLLAFARRQPLRPSVVQPRDVVLTMADLLRRALGETVEVGIAMSGEIGLVSIDVGQFEASLMNLCINARDAMPHGGTVSISLRNVETFESAVHDDVESAVDVEPGSWVCVSVADTGAGMDPDVVQHAFDPFFTTKELGRGSGLGLSSVYGFIKQSGGHVTIRSAVGAGTIVDMYLPRSQAERPDAQAAALARAPQDVGSETILVVEDDAPVRALAVRHLRQLGYAVLEASSARPALDLLRSEVPIDLLFTDVVMPGGLDGGELAAVARSIRPGLRVLYTSGYTDDAELDVTRVGDGLLQKPYRRNDLAAAIRGSLDAPAVLGSRSNQ